MVLSSIQIPHPLSSAQAVRNWMSWRTAFAAAELANPMEGLETNIVKKDTDNEVNQK